jgi:hypothetical protein
VDTREYTENRCHGAGAGSGNRHDKLHGLHQTASFRSSIFFFRSRASSILFLSSVLSIFISSPKMLPSRLQLPQVVVVRDRVPAQRGFIRPPRPTAARKIRVDIAGLPVNYGDKLRQITVRVYLADPPHLRWHEAAWPTSPVSSSPVIRTTLPSATMAAHLIQRCRLWGRSANPSWPIIFQPPPSLQPCLPPAAPCAPA